MGDKGGSKDKGKKEQQKKAKLSPKEKRKVQKDKKNKQWSNVCYAERFESTWCDRMGSKLTFFTNTFLGNYG